jgi:hypothetical protein
MVKKTPFNNASPNNENMDAVDFIANVLREHGRELEKLTDELRPVIKRLGGKGELVTALEKVEKRIGNLDDDVKNMVASKSTTYPPTAKTTAIEDTEVPPHDSAVANLTYGPPVVVKCKEWADFKTMSTEATTVWFTFRETDQVFEADALKNGKIIAYVGKIPDIAPLLKAWLSSQTKVPEDRTIEGTLVKA